MSDIEVVLWHKEMVVEEALLGNWGVFHFGGILKNVVLADKVKDLWKSYSQWFYIRLGCWFLDGYSVKVNLVELLGVKDTTVLVLRDVYILQPQINDDVLPPWLEYFVDWLVMQTKCNEVL